MDTSIHGTTILAVNFNGQVAMAADGQATQGSCVLKHSITKIRKIYNDSILVGFAGSIADALTLLEYFEKTIEKENDMVKAAVALAKYRRTNEAYKSLSADLVMADANRILMLSGYGDVIEAEDGLMAIGSGGYYALAAARAFKKVVNPDVTATDIAKMSLGIASEICIYTNSNINVLSL